MKFRAPDHDRMMKLAADNKQKYAQAHPFPSIYFDNVFQPESLSEVLNEFPDPSAIKWRKFANSYEDKKLASRGEHQFGEATKQLAHYLNSAPFLSFLEELTGIPALISDPFFDGGGLHQIVPGGFLKIHADFNKDNRTGLDRRLNVLVYLNKNWKEEYGGHFELWNKQMTKSEAKILPLFNRMAIFSTTHDSYHGHPDALRCPPDMTRKSFAAYYYSNGRPAEEVYETAPTVFQMRPGEEHLKDIEDQRKARKAAERKVKKIIKSLVPPILYGKIVD
jgi:hypothetical protein